MTKLKDPLVQLDKVVDWEAEDAKAKRRQKDVDARWTKKHGKSHYGYKNHVNADNKHKLANIFKKNPIRPEMGYL